MISHYLEAFGSFGSSVVLTFRKFFFIGVIEQSKNITINFKILNTTKYFECTNKC